MSRARTLMFVGLLGFATWRACRSSAPEAPPASTGVLHTAVLRDGFAVMESDGDRHVVEVDGEGKLRNRRAVPVGNEARVFGTPQGVAVGWHAGKQIKLALVTGDGKLGEPSVWGRNATMMCDGVASNDQRFGVGWLESDGRVWVVSGPMTSTVTAVSAPEQLARSEWCGITSAGDHIALLWREGSKTFINLCSKKECSGLVAPLPLDPRHELLAFGCTRESCLLAFRDQQSNTHVGQMGVTGKKWWSKPLTEAAQSTEVTIAPVGKKSMAVGFVAKEGATVLRIANKNGAMERLWADPSSTEVPSVAWSKDRLFVAIPEGGGVRHEVLAAPN